MAIAQPGLVIFSNFSVNQTPCKRMPKITARLGPSESFCWGLGMIYCGMIR